MTLWLSSRNPDPEPIVSSLRVFVSVGRPGPRCGQKCFGRNAEAIGFGGFCCRAKRVAAARTRRGPGNYPASENRERVLRGRAGRAEMLGSANG